MAIKQISDLYLNKQKRFSEAGVATVPARLNEGNTRLGTPPEFVLGADDYQAFMLPKYSIVKGFYLFVREGFDAGTTVTVELVNGGTPIFTDVDLSTEALFVSTEADTLFTTVDGLNFKFNQDVTQGLVQVVADFISIDEKSGKYVTQIPLNV